MDNRHPDDKDINKLIVKIIKQDDKMKKRPKESQYITGMKEREAVISSYDKENGKLTHELEKATIELNKEIAKEKKILEKNIADFEKKSTAAFNHDTKDDLERIAFLDKKIMENVSKMNKKAEPFEQKGSNASEKKKTKAHEYEIHYEDKIKALGDEKSTLLAAVNAKRDQMNADIEKMNRIYEFNFKNLFSVSHPLISKTKELSEQSSTLNTEKNEKLFEINKKYDLRPILDAMDVMTKKFSAPNSPLFQQISHEMEKFKAGKSKWSKLHNEQSYLDAFLVQYKDELHQVTHKDNMKKMRADSFIPPRSPATEAASNTAEKMEVNKVKKEEVTTDDLDKSVKSSVSSDSSSPSASTLKSPDMRTIEKSEEVVEPVKNAAQTPPPASKVTGAPVPPPRAIPQDNIIPAPPPRPNTQNTSRPLPRPNVKAAPEASKLTGKPSAAPSIATGNKTSTTSPASLVKLGLFAQIKDNKNVLKTGKDRTLTEEQEKKLKAAAEKKDAVLYEKYSKAEEEREKATEAEEKNALERARIANQNKGAGEDSAQKEAQLRSKEAEELAKKPKEERTPAEELLIGLALQRKGHVGLSVDDDWGDDEDKTPTPRKPGQ